MNWKMITYIVYSGLSILAIARFLPINFLGRSTHGFFVEFGMLTQYFATSIIVIWSGIAFVRRKRFTAMLLLIPVLIAAIFPSRIALLDLRLVTNLNAERNPGEFRNPIIGLDGSAKYFLNGIDRMEGPMASFSIVPGIDLVLKYLPDAGIENSEILDQHWVLGEHWIVFENYD